MVELLTITDQDQDAIAEFYASENWPYHSGPRLTEQLVRDRFARGHYIGPGIKTFWITKTGVRAGMLRVWDLGEENDTGTPLFDIRVRTESRGIGIGTSAIGQLVDWVFTAHPAKFRIEAYTRADNDVIKHVLRRCRFVKEAQLRQCWPGEEGAMHDCYGYAILRKDWEQGSITPVEWTAD